MTLQNDFHKPELIDPETGLPRDMGYNDCNMVLKRIHPKIDLALINNIIDNIPYKWTAKNFYRTVLKERKEKLLDTSLEKLNRSSFS